jgi:hypothetical protein
VLFEGQKLETSIDAGQSKTVKVKMTVPLKNGFTYTVQAAPAFKEEDETKAAAPVDGQAQYSQVYRNIVRTQYPTMMAPGQGRLAQFAVGADQNGGRGGGLGPAGRSAGNPPGGPIRSTDRFGRGPASPSRPPQG